MESKVTKFIPLVLLLSPLLGCSLISNTSAPEYSLADPESKAEKDSPQEKFYSYDEDECPNFAKTDELLSIRNPVLKENLCDEIAIPRTVEFENISFDSEGSPLIWKIQHDGILGLEEPTTITDSLKTDAPVVELLTDHNRATFNIDTATIKSNAPNNEEFAHITNKDTATNQSYDYAFELRQNYPGTDFATYIFGEGQTNGMKSIYEAIYNPETKAIRAMLDIDGNGIPEAYVQDNMMYIDKDGDNYPDDVIPLSNLFDKTVFDDNLNPEDTPIDPLKLIVSLAMGELGISLKKPELNDA